VPTLHIGRFCLGSFTVLASATNVHSPSASATFRRSGQADQFTCRRWLSALGSSRPVYLSALAFKTAAFLTVVKEHFADHLKPSAFCFYLGFRDLLI